MGGSGNLPIGPGIWGFIAFFVLAIALWLLVRNMNSRLRRMAYRDRDDSAATLSGTPADADGATADAEAPDAQQDRGDEPDGPDDGRGPARTD
ncbi:hypothetical protein [Terrabacter sp. MAHUQ-38]|uniref:hypothetical protein n=1 Tax=unclassified Terrabacter TaxID=2630222 RepID=UPI00165DD73E|nr:hypothetical protein [Terrabacter sp. MAHUQ-38]MBC9822040.1 hypothetical protein [Terrabacter sp. MAHUQ-38]